ncbi:hypothetical protein HDU78_010678 [Chytriomyces hyalinus]|nr:hypothetical protein HDU78_010678 [Chytriomyces hyalinus]
MNQQRELQVHLTASIASMEAASQPSDLDAGSMIQSLKTVNEDVAKLKAEHLHLKSVVFKAVERVSEDLRCGMAAWNSIEAAWNSKEAALIPELIETLIERTRSEVAALKPELLETVTEHTRTELASWKSKEAAPNPELAASRRELVEIVSEHMKSELVAWKSELVAWKPELAKFCAEHAVEEIKEIARMFYTGKQNMVIQTTADHQPQPLDVAANRSDDDAEAETRLTAKWKAVLKNFHPNAPILAYLNEDPCNRPLLKILRVFIDEFYEARNMKKDQRIREIPAENHADFVEYFVAKCKSFTGENVNEETKKRINSAFDGQPLSKNLSLKFALPKSVRANSGGGRGGSTGKKRPHASVGTDGENTPSKKQDLEVFVGLEGVESEEAEGRAPVGDK